MNLAGTIILYSPEEDIYKNIETYLPIIDILYVFDNTEQPDLILQKKINALPKVRYFHDGENMGIALRLNMAAQLAIKEGFKFLLTMDQDSFFKDHVAQNYKNCLFNFRNFSKAAMFGIEFTNAPESLNCSFSTVNELITSGSIINLTLFNEIGRFDENLFIDYVDHEYCYRAKSKGFDLIKFENIFLEHTIGKVSYRRSLLTFKNTKRSLHSPVRIYYMVRNFLYVYAIYKDKFPAELSYQRSSILIRIKNKLFYNSDRIDLLKLIFRAVKDYKTGRMGKITQK